MFFETPIGPRRYRSGRRPLLRRPGKTYRMRGPALGGNVKKWNWRSVPFAGAVLINPTVPLRRGETYPFLDMASVNPGQRYASAREMRSFAGGGSRFIRGDTLMARITPCLENGKICRYGGDGPAFGSTEFIVIRGRPGTTTNGFAYYLAQSRTVRGYAVSKMAGSSGRQRVPTDVFERLLIRVPPIPVQQRIAQILGTLDDKIELNRRMNETLEAMARAIFKSWFVDFDPVHAKAAGRDTGLPKHIAGLFPSGFENSELGMIPKGWKVGSLADVAENPRWLAQPRDIEPGAAYIGLEHMPRRSIALREWSTAGNVVSGKWRFSRGDILFGRLRPYFHKVGIAPLGGVCSTDILVIRPRHPDWLLLALGHVSSEDFVRFADAMSAGTRMPRTGWGDLGGYELALPPQATAAALRDTATALHNRLLGNIHETQRLAALRDTLLPKLLSGELPVPEAETIISEVM